MLYVETLKPARTNSSDEVQQAPDRGWMRCRGDWSRLPSCQWARGMGRGGAARGRAGDSEGAAASLGPGSMSTFAMLFAYSSHVRHISE